MKLDPESQIGLFYLNPFSNPYYFTLKALNKNPGDTVTVTKCEQLDLIHKIQLSRGPIEFSQNLFLWGRGDNLYVMVNGK